MKETSELNSNTSLMYNLWLSMFSSGTPVLERRLLEASNNLRLKTSWQPLNSSPNRLAPVIDSHSSLGELV